MFDESIDASPTAPSISNTIHSQRCRRREKRKFFESGSSIGMSAIVDRLPKQSRDLEAEERFIFNAERMDYLLARQELSQKRTLPETKEFTTLENILLSQNEPLQQDSEVYLKPATSSSDNLPFITNTELVDFCDDLVQQACTSAAISEGELTRQKILNDFCGSPTYSENEVPLSDMLPFFRFRNKKIHTYSRQNRYAPYSVPFTIDEDDRISVSSELSMQEDNITQVPTKVLGVLDANSSQRICENLLNLSAYFKQNNDPANITATSSISPLYTTAIAPTSDTLGGDDVDEPHINIEVESQSLMCTFESDEFESLAIKLTEIETDKVNKKLENAESHVDDSPVDNLSDEDYEKLLAMYSPPFKGFSEAEVCNDADQELHLSQKSSDWFIVDSSFFEHFHSQSLSAGKENRCANTNLNESKMGASLIFGEKFASKIPLQKLHTLKEIECTNGVKRHTDTVQLETNRQDLNKTTTHDFIFEDMVLSEWQPADLFGTVESCSEEKLDSEFKVPRTVSNNGKNGLKDASSEATSSTSHIKENSPRNLRDNKDFEQYLFDPNFETEFENKMELFEQVQFRTASNKAILVSEEALKRAARLIADTEADFSHQTNTAKPTEAATVSGDSLNRDVSLKTAIKKRLKHDEDVEEYVLDQNLQTEFENNIELSELVQFRTASNKAITVSEEALKRAARFIADAEADFSNQKSTKNCQPPGSKDKVHIQEQRENLIAMETVEFRTASNKIITVSESSLKRAANLMAEAKAVVGNPTNKAIAVSEAALKRATCLMSAELSEQTMFNVCAKRKLEDSATVTTTPQRNKSLRLSQSLYPVETPTTTQELKCSLPELTAITALEDTKNALMARRNLSLSKRRKARANSSNFVTNTNDVLTPVKPFTKFAAIYASTSTPLPKQKVEWDKDLQHIKWDDCNTLDSKDAPTTSKAAGEVKITEMGLLSVNDVEISPICGANNRRPGLTRKRKKR